MTGSMRGKVASRRNLFAGRGGDDLQELVRRKLKRRNRQTIGFDVYIVTYALRQTAFRSSRDIFYSAEYIFAAEHVSTI